MEFMNEGSNGRSALCSWAHTHQIQKQLSGSRHGHSDPVTGRDPGWETIRGCCNEWPVLRVRNFRNDFITWKLFTGLEDENWRSKLERKHLNHVWAVLMSAESTLAPHTFEQGALRMENLALKLTGQS